MHAARCMRIKRFPDLASLSAPIPATADDSPSTSADTGADTDPEEDYTSLVTLLGGRLSYLSQAATRADMLAHARAMVSTERAWLQSVVGLIPDHDDDVMDEQKWSTCSWLLLREFVKIRQEQEEAVREKIEAGEMSPTALAALPLPELPYYRCRQVMTRPDFLEALDRHNIIAIDINHNVTPDSLLLLHAAREVVEEDGFDDMLDDVRARVDEIESLHRTRELTQARRRMHEPGNVRATKSDSRTSALNPL
ncbi:hypothetical protein EIP86_011157 [Pleurotus ostreatoroseus]|nr:hypothetical protein EIP86_011157 [Pleurotus ostreatoroseus]